MATISRSNSRVGPPVYKDYVNFLASYKTGKKDDDSGISSVKSFSSASSLSSLSSDSTDFSKSSATSFNTYLQNSKTKKFNSVKPKFEDNKQTTKSENEEEKITKKSEIYIEIQATKPVSEVSKLFESPKAQVTVQKNNKLNSKISIFEKQLEKPKFTKAPPAKIDIFEGQNPSPEQTLSPPPAKPPTSSPAGPVVSPQVQGPRETIAAPPPPPMPTVQSPRLASQKSTTANSTPPLAPPPPSLKSPPIKLQASLIKGPQTKFTVENNSGTVPEIDRNNPMVKKLVYGTLRGLYGAYHDKASDMLATLPRNMVVRSNGVQDRIEQIAANGDLEKLNGRVNPRLEQE